MEIILYYDKEGHKQWIIADKGNTVVEELIRLGYKESDFLVIDAGSQVDESIVDKFGY